MDEYPIKVGSMLYTLVDPNKGHEVAYNRWYERDHFYGGCMVGPWLFAGSRWVATRDLKDLRFPHGDANLLTRPDDAGSYVAIYWVHEGRHAEHFAWAGNQVVELYKDGRGFNERTHAHTALYHYGETVYRDPDGVPIELALDHKYEGSVTVAVKRAEGVSAEELAQWVRTEGMPPLLADGPVAMGSVWAPELGGDNTSQAPMDLGTPAGGEDRTLQLFFTESNPAECWDRFVDYARRLDDGGLATVVGAAPFVRSIVGTDTYTDQLW